MREQITVVEGADNREGKDEPLLAIAIVTYNRPEMINHYLGTMVQKAEERDVTIWIYDGSTNDETQKVVKKYCDVGYQCIHYVYLDDSNEKERIKRRVYQALYERKAKYVWFTGDRNALEPRKFDYIYECIKMEKYDVLVHGAKEYKEYSSCAKLYRDYGWYITGWGYAIFKSDLLDRVSLEARSDYFKHTYGGFGDITLFWLAFSKCSGFRAVALPISPISLAKNVPLPPPTAFSSDSFKDVWFNNWIKANEMLPTVYDEYKDKVTKDWGRNTGVFSPRGFINQRIDGRLTFKSARYNRKCYPKVTDVNYWFILLVSILPSKMLSIIIKAIDLIKDLPIK